MRYNCRRNRPAFVRKGRRRNRPAIIDRYRYIKLVTSTISTLEELDFCCGVRFIPRHQRFIYILRKHDPILRIDVD